nr:hypothetical protein [Tanacetum cinerariifolium]
MAPLTFTDTHNMVAYLSMSDVSAGFDQIVDFLNAHVIQYAFVVNPTIYISCIKQFWASTTIKKVHDVVQLCAIIDRKKVVVTKDVIRQDLCLDDADGVECLPNEEIFVELARMGYEEPPLKLMFYKAFFSAQWKFCMVTNMDSPSKFLMVGKGFSRVETHLFASMLVQQQDAEEEVEVEVPTALAPPSPIIAPLPPPQAPTPTPHASTPLPPQEQPTLPYEVTMTVAQTLIKMKAKKANLLDDQIAKRLHHEEVEKAAARENQEKDDLQRAQVL